MDSLWIDFTKGLGAPIGAVLAGSRDFIGAARRYKQHVAALCRLVALRTASRALLLPCKTICGGRTVTMDRRPEAVEGELAVGTLLMHTEVLVTRQVSAQVKVRGGVRVAPFIYPLMLQPVVLGVWGF